MRYLSERCSVPLGGRFGRLGARRLPRLVHNRPPGHSARLCGQRRSKAEPGGQGAAAARGRKEGGRMAPSSSSPLDLSIATIVGRSPAAWEAAGGGGRPGEGEREGERELDICLDRTSTTASSFSLAPR